MAQFFLSCPLKFEEHLITEIKSFWFELMDLDGLPTREPLPDFAISPGGVEMKCPEHLGYQLNFFTKIAHRILIRIHHFPARFYDQYEKEMKVLPLKKWLAGKSVSLKIETSKSRINHERNLIEATTRALELLDFKVMPKEIGVQQIYIRIHRDQAIISLDTSGEHLHRRGYAVYRGEAPLRENLAALLSQQTYFNNANLEKITLLDPFAGSGTLIFETASFKSPNFKRAYSWLQFLNKPKIFNSESWSKNYRWLNQAQNFYATAIDSDPHACDNIERNKILFAEIFPHIKLFLNIIRGDSATIEKNELSADRPTWIISNPPYGIRLLQESVSDIFRRFESKIDVCGAIILHPESLHIRFDRLSLSSEIDFSNQGLNIKMSLFKSRTHAGTL